CPSSAGRDRWYANVRPTLAQFPTQSCRRRLLLLPSDLVGEEEHGAVFGSAIACYFYASSSSPAMVDSSDADRGVCGYGLGANAGGPRPPLRQRDSRKSGARCFNRD